MCIWSIKIMVDRKQSGLTGKAQIEDIIDHLLVKFGCEFLKITDSAARTGVEPVHQP
jgi:hypothetical protein